ncbi:M48 family metallopeptidase [Halodesulfovibrio sp.]|jgi:tetratricopeptide (TPR) repeat protein|uniref:tetratricopeptide repeat protein n=1 Tax=Halodesulfovibrio sp. TaxID=1912772 RepID=UPI0025D48C77|nr:tetratricopeptide repeat protein [Halodesulfovibrio sp.]MCT4534266.1 tetratricopeptide repeat protein [Halodesulfovibrio sp.]
MPHLSNLLKKLPMFQESRMVATGYGMWINWNGELNPAVVQTLQDYGGLQVEVDRDQALWFFFSSDVFLAAARLNVWAKFNTLQLYAQIVPAKLLFSPKREISFSLDPTLTAQSIIVPDTCQIWIHPKCRGDGNGLPGLTFKPEESRSGLAPVEWVSLIVDPRLPYQSTLGWYGVIKPLGNTMEKNFLEGWRNYSGEIKKLFERVNIKFLVQDSYLVFHLENLQMLRQWTREHLALVDELKATDRDLYWPAVVAVTNKRGVNFTPDLPKRMGLDWNQLVPDFPHMSFRSGYLLGRAFEVHDVNFSLDANSVDDWCKVTMAVDHSEESGMLPIRTSKHLTAGNHDHCFYCGMRSHTSPQCPTRSLTKLTPKVWSELASLGFEEFNKGFETIEATLGAKDPEGLQKIQASKSYDGVLLNAVYGVNEISQLRMMQHMWLCRGKDFAKGLEEVVPRDENPVWSTLSCMLAGDLLVADKELANLAIRAPRDARPRMLAGFVAMERGDDHKAMMMWKEAEILSTTMMKQAYCVFLQARLLEYTSQFQKASELYSRVLRMCPTMHDAQYRKSVCQVKIGFAEQAMASLISLVKETPHYFNRVLIDPEMERGHIQVLSALYHPWIEAENQVEKAVDELGRLKKEVHEWFDEGSPFFVKSMKRIDRMTAASDVKNYVSFMIILQGCKGLAKDLERYITKETATLKNRFQDQRERLRYIREEAAWFPFPRALVEFNKNYNLCAANISWALKTHFQVADIFKKAQIVADTEEKRLEKLEKRLKFLKVVRDSTLFMLIMSRTFFWIEVVFMCIIVVALPLTMFYGEQSGMEWATGLLFKEKWSIQKQLILGFSIFAIVLSCFRTALVFDKVREKYFNKARGLA